MSEEPLTLRQALVRTFRLDGKAQLSFIQLAWVVGMSTFALWALGFVTFLGPGFAKAADVNRVESTVNTTAKISLARELRDMVRERCAAQKESERIALEHYIEALQEDYARYNNGRRFPEDCR